jgi:predicted lactoylglutathione lyase
MRMIFVNLPVKDLDAAKAFYEAIGFTNNPMFTDSTAAAMVIEENIVVMLLTEQRFKDFITGGIADASSAIEVLNCLSADSRAEVDEWLAKARAAGAKPWKPVMEEGPMYGGSFADLDGHVWEVLHMDMSAVPQG